MVEKTAKPPADEITVTTRGIETVYDFVKGSKVLAEKQYKANNPAFMFATPPTIISFAGDKRFDELNKFAGDLSSALKNKDSRRLASLGLDKAEAAALLKARGQERLEKIIGVFDARITEKNDDYDKGLREAGADYKMIHKLGLDPQILKLPEKEASAIIIKALQAKIDAEGKEAVLKMVENAKVESSIAIREEGQKYERITYDNTEYTKLIGKGSENPDIGPVCRHSAPEISSMLTQAGYDNYVMHCRFGNPSISTGAGIGNERHATVYIPEYALMAEATADSKTACKKIATVIEDKASNGKCIIAYDETGAVLCYDNIPRSMYDSITGRDRFPIQIDKLGEFLKSHKEGAEGAFKEALHKNSKPEILDFDAIPPAVVIDALKAQMEQQKQNSR